MALALLKRHVSEFFNTKVRSAEFSIFFFAIALYFLASYLLLLRNANSLVYYGDAVSHLVIARGLFDSIHPGLIQLGSVWLPMTHILLLPFVANDFLFHTGLAGTIVSSISTAITAVVLFRIVKLQFNSERAGVLASSLYLVNPSVMYMGVIPMMEAPFMMFFVLSVYYLQKWYFNYTSSGSATVERNSSRSPSQYPTIIKAGLAISAASLTRYEGWLLPFGFIFVIFIVLFITDRKVWRHEIKGILQRAVLFSFPGIGLWIYYNLVNFNNPLYFVTGPYAIPVRASLRPFGLYLHSHPFFALSVIVNVAKAMYGIPVLVISACGIIAYLYLHRRNRKTTLFYLLTVGLLMEPMLSNFAAMLQGSGEIFPGPNRGWLDARYVILIAPLLAFCSVSFVIFIKNKGKKMALTIPAVVVLIASYSFTIVSQPLEVGKTTAMNDGYTFLPFLKHFQFAFATGEALKKIYDNGHILLFTPSQEGQQIELKSGVPLKNFIEATSGRFWITSKTYPWVYGTYLIIRKPIDTHPDPVNNLIGYWLANQSVLMKYYQVIYENAYYKILKKVNVNI
ncbi:MAG: phospholipid carrier-dependent glycosyltransferase [Thermoproteota archaeon]|nr:phospholipid carrier-dependent glycosyltransferase [Thermoproteota archaeon]